MMKKILEKLHIRKEHLVVAKNALLLAIPFMLMDTFIRILASEVHYFRKAIVFPNILFNVMWTVLFVGIVMNLKKNIGRIVYAVIFGLYFLMFLVHSIYFPYTGFFFRFSLVMMASEGSSYIMSTILNTSPYVYVACATILATAVVIIIKFPKKEKGSLRNIAAIFGVFVIVHTITPFFLGKAHSALEWDTWRNPRNVYQNFNDSNKCMKICGIYEYTFRDFYMTFIKPEPKASEEEEQFLKDAYAELTIHDKNGYTGILKGKNVIFLQLEGIDSWLLTPETMPHLYELYNQSIRYTNHFSYYNGGGSTFNSELAVNTGFLAPISYTQNAYAFTENLYPASMPKLFKELGYSVNAFHMNSGEYYSRRLNYQNWGYDNYYGLLDQKIYKGVSHELDRELILNELFYEKMFLQEEPFVHYLITYTPHTPFDVSIGKGEILAEEKFGEVIPDLTEEDCARLYAMETDKMVGLLIEALKENGLYENTAIVAFADHYLYTLSDKKILDKYKETDSNLINKTPFFIWSDGIKPATIKKVNSQLDILPTVLNMFGIEYTEELYIGNDIMDSKYSGYVFFSDYSWYDGHLYVENGEVVKGVSTDQSYVVEMNGIVNQLIYQNDLTQKYNYFKKLYKAQGRDYEEP